MIDQTELMAIIGKLNWTDQTELILELIDLTHLQLMFCNRNVEAE